MSNTTKSVSHFLRTVGEFWTLMGQRTFWQDSAKQSLALKALGHQYCGLMFADVRDGDVAQTAFSAAIEEFHRRSIYALRLLPASKAGAPC